MLHFDRLGAGTTYLKFVGISTHQAHTVREFVYGIELVVMNHDK